MPRTCAPGPCYAFTPTWIHAHKDKEFHIHLAMALQSLTHALQWQSLHLSDWEEVNTASSFWRSTGCFGILRKLSWQISWQMITATILWWWRSNPGSTSYHWATSTASYNCSFRMSACLGHDIKTLSQISVWNVTLRVICCGSHLYQVSKSRRH